MSINKATRHLIYSKFNGHCAYCGNEIKYEEMQVDHMKPKAQGGDDELDNLVPTCRLCNHYKRDMTPEAYRKLLTGLIERLEKRVYIFRVAERYGLIKINEWNKRFYFEKEATE